MQRSILILLLAIVFSCEGCQSVVGRMKRSIETAADDYERVTTGSNSKYIASQRRQP